MRPIRSVAGIILLAVAGLAALYLLASLTAPGGSGCPPPEPYAVCPDLSAIGRAFQVFAGIILVGAGGAGAWLVRRGRRPAA